MSSIYVVISLSAAVSMAVGKVAPMLLPIKRHAHFSEPSICKRPSRHIISVKGIRLNNKLCEEMRNKKSERKKYARRRMEEKKKKIEDENSRVGTRSQIPAMAAINSFSSIAQINFNKFSGKISLSHSHTRHKNFTR